MTKQNWSKIKWIIYSEDVKSLLWTPKEVQVHCDWGLICTISMTEMNLARMDFKSSSNYVLSQRSWKVVEIFPVDALYNIYYEK